jgi:Tripartite tricarboxylate transporter TctB family
MTSQSNTSTPASARTLLPRTVGTRNGGIFIAAVLAAVGLLFAWQASLIDLGDLALPGPGFFPLVLGIFVFALAVVIAGRLWAAPADVGPVEFGHRDVLIVFVALLAVPLLFDTFGAWITLGLFGAALLMLIARCPLWLAGVSAIVAMVACWYFFQVALGLQLPTGPL